ncbi:hypothetical protein [Ferroglobus sp.]|uniref:hypothetical protein n=1 Tax=Ferroglobus sp. TaxID=2614230 RepID=UPI0025C65492|nr:hypothetical protein [Ferroglobus sp.]
MDENPDQKASLSDSKTVKKTSKRKERAFLVEILSVEETGTFSRKITAKLTNKDGYARNVKVSLELLVDGERVKVNGREKLEVVVGDIKPNESTVKTVEISVSFFDGLKIKSKGYVDVKLTISWDGGREVMRKRVYV